jgi:hypothetical protein
MAQQAVSKVLADERISVQIFVHHLFLSLYLSPYMNTGGTHLGKVSGLALNSSALILNHLILKSFLQIFFATNSIDVGDGANYFGINIFDSYIKENYK